MKHLKKSYILLILLTVIIGSRTFAQDYCGLNFLTQTQNSSRANEVMQNNEYTSTGYEKGNFYCNPLMLNGKSLDYDAFNVKSKGELTVIKGAVITGITIQVSFYAYLKRDGNKVLIPGNERSSIGQTKIDLSAILQHAKPGDQLVIEPVRKEDGYVKRILKLLDGC
ncbi:MAG: hypothetical protein ABI663_02935 [Chryseolinea sp.]